MLALDVAELSARRRFCSEQAGALSLNFDRVAIDDLADIITLSAVPAVPLTEVYPQAAKSRIIVNPHDISQGPMPEWAQDPASDFHLVECTDAGGGIAKILQTCALSDTSPSPGRATRTLRRRLPPALSPLGRTFERFGFDQLDPRWRVVAGFFPAADLPINLRRLQAPGNGRAEQQMIDS